MRKIKKLFYVPGLISLAGILIVTPSFNKRNSHVKENCLTLIIPSDCKEDIPIEYQFSNCQTEKAIDKMRKLKFILTGDKEENKQKINVIRYEALKLKFTQDTSAIILINLSENSSYGEFISLIDLCKYDKHRRYTSWEDNFVIFGEWPEKKKELPEISLIHCSYQPPEKLIVKPGLIDLLKQKISKYYSLKGSYLLAGWLMLLMSFLYFRKRNSVLQSY